MSDIDRKRPSHPHHGHRQRVRERVLIGGWDALSEHEIIELLLFYAVPRQDTNETAHRAVEVFGSLANILEAKPGELVSRLGMSEAAALLITGIIPIYRRYLRGKAKERPLLTDSSKAGRYCVSLLTGECTEIFYVICLDAGRRLIAAERVSEGSVSEAAVYTRAVADAVIKYRAVNVIFSHNHPSGLLAASREDIELTRGLVTALNYLEVNVIDHIIVSGENWLSFADKGMCNMRY